MALFFKSTTFLPLLLVILLPNGGDSSIFNFGFLKPSPALVEGNQHSRISVPGSSGTVRDNQFTYANVANAKLDVQNNQFGHLEFHGGSLKLSGSQHSAVSGNDNDIDISRCQHSTVKSSSNKMTIFAKDSQHVSIQDSSSSQVTLSRVKHVKVSGADFTLEGTDIKHHTFLGKRCIGNKITHKLTVLPSEECGFFSKLRSKFSNFNFNLQSNVNGVTITQINGVTTVTHTHSNSNTITVNGVTVNSNSDCGKVNWPISLEFCNTAKVSGPTYKIGGLPSFTIKMDEKKETAVIRMTKGKAECKIVSKKGSISASSEELLIEGAKEIRRVDDGKCEFVLSLGKGAGKALPSDSPGDGVTSEDKKKNYNMLSPLFDVGKEALDLALSCLSYILDFFFFW